MVGTDVASVWTTSLTLGVNPTADVEVMTAQYEAQGFQVQQLSPATDARGDVVRLALDTDFLPNASFDVGGSTGFDFLEHNFTGTLAGHLTGSAK